MTDKMLLQEKPLISNFFQVGLYSALLIPLVILFVMVIGFGEFIDFTVLLYVDSPGLTRRLEKTVWFSGWLFGSTGGLRFSKTEVGQIIGSYMDITKGFLTALFVGQNCISPRVLLLVWVFLGLTKLVGAIEGESCIVFMGSVCRISVSNLIIKDFVTLIHQSFAISSIWQVWSYCSVLILSTALFRPYNWSLTYLSAI